MNTKHIFLTMKAIVLMLTLMALVALLIAPTAAQGDDPIQVVQTYYEAIANKDLDTIALLLADDVLSTYPGGKFQGKDAQLTSLKQAIADGYRSENSNYRESNGEVRFDYKVYFGDELVDQNTDGLTIVKDGKIVFDGLEQDKPLETLPALGSATLDPIQVVQTYYDAIANKDLDTVAALYADDVLSTYPGGKIQGKDAALTFLKGVIADGYRSENSNYRESNGEVRFDYKVYFGEELVDQNTNGLTIVKNGKIVFDGLEQDKPQGDVAPLVGTWHIQVPGEEPFEALWTFHADGTFVETSSLLGQVMEGPAHGVWQRTQAGYGLTFYVFEFDEQGQHNGLAKVHCQIQLDSPDHLTADCPWQIFDLDGNIVVADPGAGGKPDLLNEGTRLKVEPLLDPVAVVKSYYDALNAQDIDQAMSFVADDAVFINPTGTYEDPDAIRDSLQGLVTENITFELSNFRDTDGRVVYDYQVLQGKTVLETGTDGLTIIKNGKIIFDGTERTELQ